MTDNPTTLIANARSIAAYSKARRDRVSAAIITDLADALEAAEARIEAAKRVPLPPNPPIVLLQYQADVLAALDTTHRGPTDE